MSMLPKDALAAVKVGDTVFVGSHREILKPAQVEKVGKIHLMADGKRYAIRDGIQAGRNTSRAGMAYGYIRAHPYSEKLRDAYALDCLKKKFEHELAVFRSKPEAQTQERLLAVLRALNPEAWK